MKTKQSLTQKHPFIIYLIITFLIGFGLTIPMLIYNATYLALFAASSASIGGIITAILYGGKKEVFSLLKGVIQWPKKVNVYFISIGIPVFLMLITLVVYRFFDSQLPLPDSKQLVNLAPTFLLLTIQAGLGEELGWRGFALPKLLVKFTPLSASLIIGVAWAIWHLPLYLFQGFPQHDLSVEAGFPIVFSIYSLWVVAASVLHSYVYLKSEKAIIAPILFHGTINTMSWLFDFKDIKPYLVFSVVWIIAAFITFKKIPVRS